MEELASLIPIIIIAVISAIAKSSKEKKQAQPPQASFPTQQPDWAQQAAEQQKQREKAVEQELQRNREAAIRRVRGNTHTPATPKVHTHYDPDCSVHDAPSSGSLNTVSPEGKDPCHQAQLPSRRPILTEPDTEQPGLTLDWSGEALVRAFVMQEVLTRPCDRRRH